MPEIFDETFEVDSDDETPDCMRGSKDVSVGNALTEDIKIVVEEVDLVRKTSSAERHFGVGAGIGGDVHFEYGHGSTEYENCKSRVQSQTVTPHAILNMPVPLDRMSKKGKSINVTNSLQIRIFKKDSAGASTEIGDGYIVGPGHGVIVTQTKGVCRVEQANGRSWRRRYNPWVSSQGASRDPHGHLKKRSVCPECEMSV